MHRHAPHRARPSCRRLLPRWMMRWSAVIAGALLLWSGGGLLPESLAQQQQPAADGMVTSSPDAAVSAAPDNTTGSRIILQECVSYSADVGEAVMSSDGSAVMSAVLVGDTLGRVVGAVDVRDLAVDHARLGALMVTLSWLPYADELGGLNPRELEEAANATVILKDIRQGGSGANISSATFSDTANTTIPIGPADNLSGIFRPATPLALFSEAQLPSRGRWVLVAEDVGSGHKNRSMTLKGWRLVLCPPRNETLPPSLREQMAQQALGGGGGGGLLGAFAARAASQPLAAAIGTLVTRDSTIEYKTYSQLADQAVEAAIRFEDNVQLLFGLPYQPPAFINVWLPWVELLIGGTDFTIQNAVWPGKIVYYALQLEVFARTREMMSASGGGSGGGGRRDGGSGGGAGGVGDGANGLVSFSQGDGIMTRNGTNSSSGSTDETPNCGIVDGPNGPVVINKKLLQRQLCGLMMPLEYAQYANISDLGVSGGGGGGGGGGGDQARAPTDGSSVSETRVANADYADYLRSSGGNLDGDDDDPSELPDGGAYEDGDEDAGGAASADYGSDDDNVGGGGGGGGGTGRTLRAAQDRGLGLLASSGALRFPTPLSPLDFTAAPQFPQAGGLMRAPLELQRALLDGVGGVGGSDRRSSLLRAAVLGRQQQSQQQQSQEEAANVEQLEEPSSSGDQEQAAGDSSGSGSSSTSSGSNSTSSGSNSSNRRGPRRRQGVGSTRPSPDAINQIIERAFRNLEMEGFNKAMINELEVAIARGERVSSILNATAVAPELISRGGNQAVTTAQALRASAETYTEVLRAGQDSLKRFSQQQLRNWTREWLKNGGIKQELDGMNKAGSKRRGQVNRFVWVFNRIRLTFRFSAEDGFQLSFIQWIYNWGDVNQIIGLANTLQAMDNATNGRNKRGNNQRNSTRRFKSDGIDENGGGQVLGQPWKPQQPAGADGPGTAEAAAEAADTVEAAEVLRPSSGDGDGGGTVGGTQHRAGLLPTGETPAEWMRRVRGEADALARRALSRIPIDHTLGFNRRTFASTSSSSQMG